MSPTAEKSPPKSKTAQALHRHLEAYRKKTNLTQKAFTYKIRLTPNAYRTWEKGEHFPQYSRAIRALEYIGLSTSEADAFLEKLYLDCGEEFVRGDVHRSGQAQDVADGSFWSRFLHWLNRRYALALGMIVVAGLCGLAAFISLKSDADLPPEELAGETLRGECVPRAGPVGVRFLAESKRNDLEFECPDSGWLDTGLPTGAKKEIDRIFQQYRASTDLAFGFLTDDADAEIFRPRQSATGLLWKRQVYKIQRICPDIATKMKILIEGSEEVVLCSDAPPKQITVTSPKHAVAEVIFISGDQELASCQIAFEPRIDHPIDLTDETFCASKDQRKPLPTSVPLRPFWAKIDTYLDPATGHLWQVDIHRFGPSKAWGPPLDLADVLGLVAADTGMQGWDLATVDEVKSLLNLSAFQWQVDDDATQFIDGLARDATDPCRNGSIVRIARKVTKSEPGSAMQSNDFKCTLYAAEQGFWLIRRHVDE